MNISDLNAWEISALKTENENLVKALRGLAYSRNIYSETCFCEMAIGNPMYNDHTPACKRARAVLEAHAKRINS